MMMVIKLVKSVFYELLRALGLEYLSFHEPLPQWLTYARFDYVYVCSYKARQNRNATEG